MKRIRITPKRLQEWRELAEQRVRYWQNVLGLNDWEVKVEISTKSDVAVGETTFWWTLRRAVIHLTPDVFTETWPVNLDETIVHEMLHWMTAPIVDTSEGAVADAMYETVLNTIARALARLANSRIEEVKRDGGSSEKTTSD